MRDALHLVAIAALLSSCTGAPPAPVVAHPAPTESAPQKSAPPAPEDMRVSLRAALQPDVVVHAGPIAESDDAAVAWVGTNGATRARVRLVRGEARPEVTPMPPGVRALAAFRHAGRAVALIESLALIDQPAGLVTIDSSPALDSFGTGELVEMAGLRTTDAARAWLDRRPPHPAPVAARARGVPAAAPTPDPARPASIHGVDLVRTWQGVFARREGHVDASDPALRALLAAQTCVGGEACVALDARGIPVTLEHELEGDARRIVRAVHTDEDGELPSPLWRPQAVSSSASTTATEAAARRLGVVGHVLAEASLGRTGTIGVVRVHGAGGDASLVSVEREGDFERALAINASLAQLERAEIGFADLDGDGRTDVVVGAVSGLQPDPVHPRGVTWQAHLSPRTVAATEMRADAAATFLMIDAPTLREAIAAAVALPPGGVTASELCPLVARLSRAATARAALAHARRFTYTEPGMPQASAHAATVAGVGGGGAWPACEDFGCDPTRPFCRFNPGPETHSLVLARDPSGQLRIAVAALYTGS